MRINIDNTDKWYLWFLGSPTKRWTKWSGPLMQNFPRGCRGADPLCSRTCTRNWYSYFRPVKRQYYFRFSIPDDQFHRFWSSPLENLQKINQLKHGLVYLTERLIQLVVPVSLSLYAKMMSLRLSGINNTLSSSNTKVTVY